MNGVQLTSWQALKNGMASTGKVMLKSLLKPTNLVIAGVGAMIAVLYKTNEAVEEVRERADELSNTFNNNKSDIEGYKDKIKDLYKTINDSGSSLEEVTTARQTLMTVQDELIDKFGDEKETIDLVTQAIYGQSNALDILTQKKWQETKNEFNESDIWNDYANWQEGYSDNIDRMVHEMENAWGNIKMSTSDYFGGEYDDIIKRLEEAGWEYSSAYETFVKGGSVEDLYEEILDIQTLVGDDMPKNFLDSLTKDANELKATIDSYEGMWDNYILNDKIFADDNLADSWKEVNDAYTKYQNAVASGDKTAIEEATSGFATSINEVLNDENVSDSVKDYFKDMYPALYREVEKWEFKTNIIPEFDTKGLNGKTQADILEMLQTDGTQDGEDVFNSIVDSAIKYGLILDDDTEGIQKILDLLVEWGILQGTITDTASQNPDEITDLFTNLTTSKETLEDFISAVESASNAYSTLMNPNVSTSDMLSSILSITEAVSEMGGKLNWEFIESSDNSLKLLGDTIDYVSEKYTKSALVDAGFGEEFAETLANSIVESQKAARELENVNTQIDSLQTAYDDLTDIVKTYNKTGYITFDQLQTLLELEPQYLACLVDENGQLQLNQQAMAALANQRLNDAETQAVQQAIAELGVLSLQDEKTAAEENAQAFSDAVTDLSLYNTELANTIAETSVAATAIRDLNAAISGAESKGASDNQIDTVLNNLDTKLQLINSARNKISSGGLKEIISSSSTKDDFEETLDWVETVVSRIQRTITNLGKTVSATYKNWSTRNNALAQEMSAINQEIATQQNAYNTYMNKANSVNLSEHYKELVRNGGFSIEDITDETLADNIKLYQEYYEKALDASDAVEDLRSNLAELAMTKFENVSKEYDDRIALIEHHTSMLEGYVSRAEAAGFWASEVYYQKMAEKELENINQLQSKYNDLTNALNESIANGSIERYSEDWYEMRIQIDDVESSIQEANTALVEFNQTLQQIHWDIFDRASDYKDLFIEESNFLAELISRRDLYNEVGSLTADGLAVQGLHAVNYNAYMEKSEAYAEEILKLNEEIANDPNDLELIDRRNELIGLQQEAIENAMSEKDSIVDLYKNGYDKMLSSLDALIDKRKTLLDETKSLYDYEKSISEQTSNIASLRKQLQAYSGDNSESAKATIQKLKISLSEAESSLRESEFERYIEEEQKLLDSLADDTEEWVNTRLDNIDGLVSEAIQATNDNSATISGVITSTAETLGYTLSEYANMLWSGDNDNTTLLLKAYEDVSLGVDVGVTRLETVLNSIDQKIQTMVEDLNAQATVESESISQPEITYNETNNYDTGDYEPPQSTSSGITFNGGTFYEDSYKGGDTGNSKNQWTGHEVEVTKESGTGMVHIVDKTTGTVLGWVDKDQLRGYATGTTNAKKGFNLVSEKGDELIRDKDGNIILAKGEQIFPFKGGETVFNAAKTAELLSGNLIPLSAEQLWGNIVKTPKLPEMVGRNTGSNIQQDINVHFELPNVTDANSLITELQQSKRFEKIIQSMTADQMLGKGSLGKFTY